MLWVQEQFVNRTRGGMFGESDPQESRFESLGELYRFCVREYGRCTGKVYVDGPDGKAIQGGWVFLSRQRYEDAKSPADTYLREVWVTVHDGPPVRTVDYQYHDFAA